jgi:hypothetical protein
MKKLTAHEKSWTQGFAAALSTVFVVSPDKALPADVLHESGLSLDDLKAAGVEDYDFDHVASSVREKGG